MNSKNKDFLDILVEISEIMNMITDIDSLLKRIVELAKEYLQVQRVSVMLKEGDCLKIVAGAGLNFDYKDFKVKIGDGASGKVAQTGEPLIINEINEPNKDFGYQAKSYMCIPLKVKEKVIGVLNITDKIDDYFDENDIKIGKYLSSQCALAIERYNLYEEEKRNEKLALIGKFTSAIAHDIKNLLNIVQGYLELMEIEIEDNPDIKEYTDSIITELKLIHGLTLDILDFSKRNILLKKEKVLLSELLNLITKHANIMLRFTEINFEIYYNSDIELFIDKEKIFRVFMNLLSNSIEALNEKGLIKLTVEVDDKLAVFEFFDNGPGIKKENIDKIFDPFFTAGKIKGTGLGLAVAKEIIQAHGGEIGADSVEGEYTKFIIKLPI
ncbi:GAF domain-containing sensor histidine kinase [Deferribacter thermophilus]|uniref:ATP-binding protein n=1 Tax=Deferribacter thermophilus TaxID=53573 RepID=UPI003C19E0A6